MFLKLELIASLFFLEIIYTITFLTNIAAVAQGVSYHVVTEKPTDRKHKNIRIMEIVKSRE